MAQLLVIEDDPDALYSMCDVLLTHGYDTLAVPSGEAALAKLREGLRPCLILLDLGMPGIGGQEVARMLVVDPQLRSIPIVVVTGAEKPDLPGAIPVLRKPVEVEQLLAMIQVHCSKKE